MIIGNYFFFQNGSHLVQTPKCYYQLFHLFNQVEAVIVYGFPHQSISRIKWSIWQQAANQPDGDSSKMGSPDYSLLLGENASQTVSKQICWMASKMIQLYLDENITQKETPCFILNFTNMTIIANNLSKMFANFQYILIPPMFPFGMYLTHWGLNKNGPKFQNYFFFRFFFLLI